VKIFQEYHELLQESIELEPLETTYSKYHASCRKANEFSGLAYFDCVAGASGDMILGAFVDAGMPVQKLHETAPNLGIAGLQLNVQKNV